MNNIKQSISIRPTWLLFYSFLVLITTLCSCEQVIDIQIDEADKKYVIEGNVSNLPGANAEVRISKTKTFNESNVFSGVSGAVVTIQVNNGSVYTLQPVAAGIYRSSSFAGVPGSTYRLTVVINGSTFSSLSVMPGQLVSLDNITVENLNFGAINTKTVYPDYVDPSGKGNSYRFIQYANGDQVKKVFVQDDEISDGLRINRPLLNANGDLKSGDTVQVDMLCIDNNVYKYWYSLDQASTGENQNATPANPVSNIQGGALGYFSAHTVSSRTIILP
mgnify:CR=1 FL=1